MASKKLTKKMEKHWFDYIHTLSMKGTQYPHDCYNNPSQAKWDAFNDILARCKETGGHHLSIISYSIHSFTTGYVTDKLFVVDTRTNTYYHPLDLSMKQELINIGVM